MLKRLRGALRAGAAAALLFTAGVAAATDDPSPAEVALFVTDHLAGLQAPARLHYAFTRGGTLEPGFSDSVEVSIDAAPDGRRSVLTRCLSGERKVELPALDHAQGNPALLCFLERDIRHMQRLTGGRSNYFRQRIRLALARHAEVRAVTLNVGDRQVAGREIRIAPYLDDPRRARFERYAGKFYVFRVSDEVPGGIVGIEAVIPGGSANNAPPLLADALKWSATPPDGEGNKKP
jgi:hypothetical protein